jgi:hypothetical protein
VCREFIELEDCLVLGNWCQVYALEQLIDKKKGISKKSPFRKPYLASATDHQNIASVVWNFSTVYFLN